MATFAGPGGTEVNVSRPMQLVEERAPHGFDRIDDVITRSEIDEITEGYRRTAGFALAALDDPTSLADRAY